jgi:uncharacterized membrane protein YuzA (DUF378 family)
MHGFFGMIVWLLVVIGAVNWGLDAFGYNLFKMKPFVTMPQLVMAIKVLVGIAGVISLIYFLNKLF